MGGGPEVPRPSVPARRLRRTRLGVIDLRFIKRAKELGFLLKETSELLSIERKQDATAADVKTLAERKVADLEGKIRALQRMKRALRKVAESCPGRGPTAGCSILRSLTEDPSGRRTKK